jgi:hypothetical protein
MSVGASPAKITRAKKHVYLKALIEIFFENKLNLTAPPSSWSPDHAERKDGN